MQKSTKSKWLLLVIGIVVLGASASTFSKNSLTADKNSALAEIKKEPKVKDVVLTDANVLYAAVADDGSKRDGYAEYLCGILKKHSVTGVRVKIVKFGSMNDPKRNNAYGILLGESWCK